MGKMQEILSNEGGTPVVNTYAVEIGDALWSAIYDYLWEHRVNRDDDMMVYGVYEEGEQKYAILRDRKSLKYYRLNFSLTEEKGFVVEGDPIAVEPDFKPVGEAQFALEAIEAFEAEYAKSKEEEEKEPAAEQEELDSDPEPVPAEEPETDPEPVEEPKDDEEPVQYKLEDVVEYQELLANYNALESKVAELNQQITTLTAENETLAAFKLEVDREKKKTLINETFYMLSDDEKKDCLDNIDTYSYDDIEAKLSVICVRNKVSFSLDKPVEEKPITYNLNEVEDSNAGLPAWVMRVMEEQKKL